MEVLAITLVMLPPCRYLDSIRPIVLCKKQIQAFSTERNVSASRWVRKGVCGGDRERGSGVREGRAGGRLWCSG